MSGNSFGKNFIVSTFGESHGLALGCIVDGCPPGMELTEADIQVDLDRRRPGRSRHTTQRNEPDQVKILSGVFEGRTTGTPIGLIVENKDQRSKDYGDIKDKFRPGHADYTYHQKYGIRDYRGGGRSSARETTMRVAAGAIARKYLAERAGIRITGYLSQLGPIRLAATDLDAIDDNAFFCAEPERIDELAAFMDELREQGDSIGAKISVLATGLPPGLGEPVFDKLEADIAKGLMSINAVKGVELGAGFAAVEQRGSQHRDEIGPDGFVRPGSPREHCAQTDEQHLGAGQDDRQVRQGNRDRHEGPARSLRRPSRHADRRSHGRARTHGPFPETPGAERRRVYGHAGHQLSACARS